VNEESPEFEILYPLICQRKRPSWLSELERNEAEICAMMKEVYDAFDANLHRLAGIGIRTLVEIVMVAKVGDQGTFPRTLDAFEEQRFITPNARQLLNTTIELGHASAHRAYRPNASDLNRVIGVVENIIQEIYIDPDYFCRLNDNIPRRGQT
jgi:hypothetical protein